MLVVAAVGGLLFGSLLVVSLANPEWIEAWARTLLRAEIERRVGAEMALAQDGSIAGGAIARWPGSLLTVRPPSCLPRWRPRLQRCAMALAPAVQAFGSDAFNRQRALRQSGRAAYVDTHASCIAELRIFAGGNAGVFLLPGAVVWWRDARSALLPALVLIGGAALTGGLYLFGQSWLHAIVFDSDVGYGDIVWLGGAAGFLADIAVNRGRVTQCITNGIGSALPS